ncbi:hypothetical protein A2U01_0058068, partial [Trifolium medium]|nr:hypothetical protein [Trifolium medium]
MLSRGARWDRESDSKDGKTETCSLQREKATGNCRNPKIPGLSERKRQETAGIRKFL